jgi:predicted alpha/beta-hydrolase family hydrolase
MTRWLRYAGFAFLTIASATAIAAPVAVDIPTRAGVTQRLVLITPKKPKAAVILFAGGNGWIDIQQNGHIKRAGNFLVRSRQLFADQGLMVAVVDAPSDRQRAPYLSGFRQTAEHVADIKAVIAWLKQQANVPVWLIGTSRGTQSAAFVAARLAGSDGGPDGLVLTSTILTDSKGSAVPEKELDKLHLPTLVVHHQRDDCKHCQFSDMPRLMGQLAPLARKELISFTGGLDEGDPCEARAYHGFNGIEPEVVSRIASWILQK